MAHVVTFLIFCIVLYSWIGAGLFPSLPFCNKIEKINFGDLDGGINNIIKKLSVKHLIEMNFLSIYFLISISGIRRHLGWFTLFIFSLEGVFGMAPAIYMDGTYLKILEILYLTAIFKINNQIIDDIKVTYFVFKIVSSDGKSCNATQSSDFSAEAFVGAHVTLQVIFPYLIPFVFFLSKK